MRQHPSRYGAGMATNAEQAIEKFQAAVGQPEGTGEWFLVTQDQINAFADITFDRQFSHVDPELAALYAGEPTTAGEAGA